MNRLRWNLCLVMLSAPLLMGFGGQEPFEVARAISVGGNFVPGVWKSSAAVSYEDEVTVVVMASWCPHCHSLLDRIEGGDGRSVDMVLFYDSEYDDALRSQARSGRLPEQQALKMRKAAIGRRHLTNPGSLEGKNLPFYFAKRSQFRDVVKSYPTVLSCTRQSCRKIRTSELAVASRD